MKARRSCIGISLTVAMLACGSETIDLPVPSTTYVPVRVSRTSGWVRLPALATPSPTATLSCSTSRDSTLEGHTNREVNAGSWIARASDGQAFLETTWQTNDQGKSTTYELVAGHRQVQLHAADTSSAEFMASANEEATSAWDTLTGYIERPGADRLCWEQTGDGFCPTACATMIIATTAPPLPV